LILRNNQAFLRNISGHTAQGQIFFNHVSGKKKMRRRNAEKGSITVVCTYVCNGEPLWLSGKVVKNGKINEIERTRVRSPHRATSLKKVAQNVARSIFCEN
jgi:hypothetical protein